MATDVIGDEGAQRHDGQLPRPGVVQRRPGEPAAKTDALIPGIDLSVEERDPPVIEPVLREARELPVRPDLIARLLAVVAHLDAHPITPLCSANCPARPAA